MQYSIFADGLWLDDDWEAEELMELDYDGITMEIKVDTFNSGEIVRIISSDPNDYLNMNYQPGTKLEFKPVFE